MDVVQFKKDDFSMRTEFNVFWQFSCFKGPKGFDEKCLHNRFLAFTLQGDFRPKNKYVSRKLTNWSTLSKMHLKFDCFIGILVNGVREIKIFTFLNKNPPAYEVFREPQTKHCTEINKMVWVP